MAEYATTQEVQNIVDKAVAELSEIIAGFAQQVDERFNRVEQDIPDLKSSHDRLINTIDGFVARIDRYETEQTARDSQFENFLFGPARCPKKLVFH